MNFYQEEPQLDQIASESGGQHEVEDLTESQNAQFAQYIREGVAWYEERGLTPDIYLIMRNGLLKLYRWEAISCFFATILAEFCAVYYTKMVGDLISFIKETTPVNDD